MSNATSDYFSQVKAAIRGNEISVLNIDAGLPMGILDGDHHACPVCGGTDRFNLAYPNEGGVRCNTCFPDGNHDCIAAVMHFKSIGYKAAMKRIGDRLGVPGCPYDEEGSPLEDSETVVEKLPPPSKAFDKAKPEERAAETASDATLHDAYLAMLGVFQLAADDRKRLHGRGITDAEINARGYRTFEQSRSAAAFSAGVAAVGADSLALVPGFDVSRKAIRCAHDKSILIPVRDLQGLILGVRVRVPDEKVNDGESKYRWLSSRSQRTNPNGPKAETRAHVPLGTSANSDIVRVVEGEFKADIATITDPQKIPTISIPGVQSSGRAFPVIEKMGAKSIRIAFDADFRTNDAVAKALLAFIGEAEKRGLSVGVETWPAACGKGIDDVLRSSGAKSIQLLSGGELARLVGELEERVSAGAGDSSQDHVLRHTTDPATLAEKFIRDRVPSIGNGTAGAASIYGLKYWREDWYQFEKNRYRRMSEKDFKPHLHHWLEEEAVRIAKLLRAKGSRDAKAMRITPPITASVLASLQSKCVVDSERCELFGEFEKLPRMGLITHHRHWIAAENGVLDLSPIIPSRPCPESEFKMQGAGSNYLTDSLPLRPHSPDWFSCSCLKCEYDPKATAPKFMAIMKENLSYDAAKLMLAQEWCGYQLIADNSFQKFLCCLGDGANGKSVFGAVIQALVGEENCSMVPLEDFKDSFALASTIGKLVNISSDSGDVDKMAEGKLKSFTGGDRMSLNRKNQSYWTGSPSARITIISNSIPRFSDKSAGMYRRIIPLLFDATIPVERRIADLDKPRYWVQSGEMPGILNWALEGLRRLKANGQFTIPEQSTKACEEMRLEANPALAFLREYYSECDQGEVYVNELYGEYELHCRLNGNRYPMGLAAFGKEVKRAFPKSAKEREASGARLNYYVGIQKTKCIHEFAEAVKSFTPSLSGYPS